MYWKYVLILGQIRFVRLFDFVREITYRILLSKVLVRCCGVIHKAYVLRSQGIGLNPVIHALSLPATLDISHLSRPTRGELDQVLWGI
jgi:hypothetical protein